MNYLDPLDIQGDTKGTSGLVKSNAGDGFNVKDSSNIEDGSNMEDGSNGDDFEANC